MKDFLGRAPVAFARPQALGIDTLWSMAASIKNIVS